MSINVLILATSCLQSRVPPIGPNPRAALHRQALVGVAFADPQYFPQTYQAHEIKTAQRWNISSINIKRIQSFGPTAGYLPIEDPEAYLREISASLPTQNMPSTCSTLSQNLEHLSLLSEEQSLKLCYGLIYSIYCVRHNFDPDYPTSIPKPNAKSTLRVQGNAFSLLEYLKILNQLIKNSPSCDMLLMCEKISTLSLFDIVAAQAYYALQRNEWDCLSLVIDIFLECSLSPIILIPGFDRSLKKFAQNICCKSVCIQNDKAIPDTESELIDNIEIMKYRLLITLYQNKAPEHFKEDDLHFLLTLFEKSVFRFIYKNQYFHNCDTLLEILAPFIENEAVKTKLQHIENYASSFVKKAYKQTRILNDYFFLEKLIKMLDKIHTLLNKKAS